MVADFQPVISRKVSEAERRCYRCGEVILGCIQGHDRHGDKHVTGIVYCRAVAQRWEVANDR